MWNNIPPFYFRFSHYVCPEIPKRMLEILLHKRSLAYYKLWSKQMARKVRFPVAALDLEYGLMKEIEFEPSHLEHLDLSVDSENLKDLKDDEDGFRRIVTLSLIDFELDFITAYLKKSNDLPKYLYKYLNLQKKSFTRSYIMSACSNFCFTVNLMHEGGVNDGVLLSGFLLLVDMWILKDCVRKLQSNVLEFLLQNLKNSGHERNLPSHQSIRKRFPLTICDVTEDFTKMQLLLKFGHENYFEEKYLLESLFCTWKKYFQQSFREIEAEIIRIHSYKRIYFILMMYGTFNKQESGRRDAILAVIKQMWRALPDPFITSQEIDTLGVLLPPEMDTNIRSFRLKFEQEFGDCIPTPRSLRHLSRCAVRTAINANGKLPEGVEQLPIPITLKCYLLLEK